LGFLAEALVGCLAAESAVRAMVVVVVLPLLQLLGEEVGVVDDLALEESVELLRVDAVGSLHFAVQPGCPRFDLDVVDAFVEQVPVDRNGSFEPQLVVRR
jgi:hypothetical protein